MGIVQQRTDEYLAAKKRFEIFDASVWWAPDCETSFRPMKDWDAQVRHMEEKGISDVYELYSEYVGRVTDHILSLGKTPMVWEGFPKLGSERIDRRTVVIAWESHYHLAPDLLAEGFKIINATWQPLYLVPSLTKRWSVWDILNWNVYNWQHWWEHSVATEHPINVKPTDKVLGSILCFWEMTYEQEIARVMENLMAMSERVWTVERCLSDADYKKAFSRLYSIVSKVIEKGSGRKAV